ncbi:MAG TPA: AraC family transcriptional regulator [Bacteroidales bacterium]
MIYSISELACYFGGLLGLIVSVIILVLMKGKPLIKRSLALFMIIASVCAILGALTFSGKIVHYPNLFRIDSPLHYLFPSVVLFYVYATFKPGFKFKKVYLLNLLPFLFNLIQLLPFYFSSAAEKIETYQAYAARGGVMMPVHYTLKTLFIFVYFALQLQVFYKYKQKKASLSAYQSSLNKWFFVLFSGQAVLLGGLFIEIFSGFSLFADPYRFSMLMTAYFIYQLSIALLFLPRLLYGNLSETAEEIKKYPNSRLIDEEKTNILARLESYMNHNVKPYLNPKLSLEEVSRELNVQPNQLSQVINEKTGSNFNQFINKFRVEESKIILASPDYNKLTIEAIAQTAGFKSKSTFYGAFKTHTGMTPKQFAENSGKN